jgi:DNA polymerase-1
MKLLLVDGHYYAYRSFYAIRHLTNSRQEPTNMLYGYAKALKRMVVDLQPDYAAVVMDGGLPVERLAVQGDYKANRAETPPDLVKQLPLLERLVTAMGISHLVVPGEEADDVIASYARAMPPEGPQVVIATNDKDIMQMVNERIRIYQPGSDGFTLLDSAGVEEKWGVPPHQVGEVLRLTGDSVDNIPGVPGVGPKTAAGLVRQFGSVEALLANLAQVKNEKLRLALEQSCELIIRNRTMVGLRTGLALPKPWSELKIQPDWVAQVKLFQELEFKTFTREAEEAMARQAKPMSQQELF